MLRTRKNYMKPDQEQFIRSNAPTARPLMSVRLAETSPTNTNEQLKGGPQQQLRQTPLRNKPHYWILGLYCVFHPLYGDYYRQISLKSWFTNLEQTGQNRCQPLPTPDKQLLNRKMQYIAYYSSYNPSICITYPCTWLHSQSHHMFNNGYSIYWLIKSLTRVFEISTDLKTVIDSEDGFQTGCRNLSPKQQSFSGLKITHVIFFNHSTLLLGSNHFLSGPDAISLCWLKVFGQLNDRVKNIGSYLIDMVIIIFFFWQTLIVL